MRKVGASDRYMMNECGHEANASSRSGPGGSVRGTPGSDSKEGVGEGGAGGSDGGVRGHLQPIAKGRDRNFKLPGYAFDQAAERADSGAGEPSPHITHLASTAPAGKRSDLSNKHLHSLHSIHRGHSFSFRVATGKGASDVTDLNVVSGLASDDSSDSDSESKAPYSRAADAGRAARVRGDGSPAPSVDSGAEADSERPSGERERRPKRRSSVLRVMSSIFRSTLNPGAGVAEGEEGGRRPDSARTAPELSSGQRLTIDPLAAPRQQSLPSKSRNLSFKALSHSIGGVVASPAAAFKAFSTSATSTAAQRLARKSLQGRVRPRMYDAGRQHMSFKTVAIAVFAIKALEANASFRKKLFGHDHAEAVVEDAQRRPFMIDPSHPAKKAWDATLLMGVVWLSLRIPFVMAFSPNDGVLLSGLDETCSILMIVDVFLTFRTEWHSDGDRVSNPREVARLYLKSWFPIDAVASFPYVWVTKDPRMLLLRVLRLMRLATIEKAERAISERLELTQRTRSFIRLFKLGIYVLIAGHLVGCVWYMIADSEGHQESSWTTKYGVDPESGVGLWTQYSAAIYWSFTTLTTVGYGDVSAHTDSERAFAILMILAGALLFGMIVGKMGALSQDMSQRDIDRAKHDSDVSTLLKHYRVPRELRERVRTYFKQQSREHPQLELVHRIAPQMAPSLRRDFFLHIHNHIINLVPLLRMGSFGFRATVASMLTPVVCRAGDFVVIRGEVAQAMYFIHFGEVHTLNPHGHIVATLQQGGFFGERPMLAVAGLFADLNRRYDISACCKTAASLYSLTKERMMELLAEFPDFGQALKSIGELGSSYYAMNSSDAAQPGGHGNAETPTARSRMRYWTASTYVAPPKPFTTWREVRNESNFKRLYDQITSSSRSMQAALYNPKPRDLSETTLPVRMAALSEFQAQNMHEVWAAGRIAQGWTWGPVRDNVKRKHPDLRPFEELGDESKAYDRETAGQVLKLCTVLGYKVRERDTSKDVVVSPKMQKRRSFVRQGLHKAAGRKQEIFAVTSTAAAPMKRSALIEARRRGSMTPRGTHVKRRADAGSSSSSDAASLVAHSGSDDEFLKLKRRSSAESRELRGHGADGSRSSKLAKFLSADAEQKRPYAASPSRGESLNAGARIARRLSRTRRPSIPARDRAAPFKRHLGVDWEFGTREPGAPADATYTPRPYNPPPIKLPPEVLDLVHTLSEHVHDTWARAKMDSGWRWGQTANDVARTHPNLLPYIFLKESEKEFDRKAALETIRTIYGLGFELVRSRKVADRDHPAVAKVTKMIAAQLRRRRREKKLAAEQKKQAELALLWHRKGSSEDRVEQQDSERPGSAEGEAKSTAEADQKSD